MMRTRPWLAALAVALLPSLAMAGSPPSSGDHADPRHTAPETRAQSAIGRALAGLLQQLPAPRTTSSGMAASTDAPRDATGDVRQADRATTSAPADRVEIAVH